MAPTIKPEVISLPTETIVEQDEQYLSCPTFAPDQEIKSTSSPAIVMIDDVSAINHSLVCVGAAWELARSIDDVCKLSITTTKLLTERRRLLLMSLEPNDDDSRRKGRGPVAPLSGPTTPSSLQDEDHDPRRSH